MRTIASSTVTLLATAAIVVVGNWYWWNALMNASPARRATAEVRSLIGLGAPNLTALNPSGQYETLHFDAQAPDTVLYVISPDCDWCVRNQANMDVVVSKTTTRFRFIGLYLSPGDGTEYARDRQMPFPLYSNVAGQSRVNYQMGGAPQTVVIQKGVVTQNWVGAYAEGLDYEVQSFFGVRLPGLLPEVDRNGRRPANCVRRDGGVYSPGASILEGGMTLRCSMSGSKWERVNR